MQEGPDPFENEWQRKFDASVADERARVEEENHADREELWTFSDLGRGGRAAPYVFGFVILGMGLAWLLTDASWAIRGVVIGLVVVVVAASAPFTIRQSRARRAREHDDFAKRPPLPM